jgi:hypothetical protein
MTASKFDVQKWLNWGKHPKNFHPSKAKTEIQDSSKRDMDVESVIIKIEAYRLDLTCNYNDWVTIGFALADEYGMAGGSRFHRISRFHPKYDPQECEAQYRKCLRGKSGVTIRTFFWMAAQAGILP